MYVHDTASRILGLYTKQSSARPILPCTSGQGGLAKWVYRRQNGPFVKAQPRDLMYKIGFEISQQYPTKWGNGASHISIIIIIIMRNFLKWPK